jgi:hypothetical protein
MALVVVNMALVVVNMTLVVVNMKPAVVNNLLVGDTNSLDNDLYIFFDDTKSVLED